MSQRVIDSFWDEHRFLSNFYVAEFKFMGFMLPTVEHGYQAFKTDDYERQMEILDAETPGQAKRLGQRVNLRPDWDIVKVGIMTSLVRVKFFTNEELATKLLATRPLKLIEGNTWGDTFWGVCNGRGENYLGRILMKVRRELRQL